jgi:catalase
LQSAIAFQLSHCDDPPVYKTYTKLLNKIDTPLAKDVAEMVNGTMPEGPPCENHGKKSEPLSQFYYAPKKPTIASRRIAILVADGFNMAEVEAVRGMLASEKATTWIIGPRRGKIYAASASDDEKSGVVEGAACLVADHHFEGQRSTLFDALYIPSGAEHAKTLHENGRVVHWVREAFGHCKAIAAIGEGKPFTSNLIIFCRSRCV